MPNFGPSVWYWIVRRFITEAATHVMTKVPTFDQLLNPLIAALRDLGGSGSIEEIYERVIENLKLPEEVLSVLHDPEDSNKTEVYYRLAWARTYLKKYGAVTNSSRGGLVADEARPCKRRPQESRKDRSRER
jgi:restriction endonuclease Mrr